MLVKPISQIFHSYITKKLKEYNISSVLDIGGKGKMYDRGFRVMNADIRYGIDGRKLPFDDNQYDATISIATLEHVGDIEDQVKFIQEAKRVAKYKSIHWFPVNCDAEKFLKEIGHNHPCIVPNPDVIMKRLDLHGELIVFSTVKEHFLLLATMYPKLNIPKLYDYILINGHKTFSVILDINI